MHVNQKVSNYYTHANKANKSVGKQPNKPFTTLIMTRIKLNRSLVNTSKRYKCELTVSRTWPMTSLNMNQRVLINWPINFLTYLPWHDRQTWQHPQVDRFPAERLDNVSFPDPIASPDHHLYFYVTKIFFNHHPVFTRFIFMSWNTS